MKIVDNTLFEVTENDIINNSFYIPKHINIISKLAFNKLKNIEKIDLTNIKVISNAAFFGCENLKSITSTTNISKIENSAFWGCSSLKSFIIPNNITKIEDSTFRDCSSLEYINIPNSITDIGDGAFFGCNNLKTVDIKGSISNIGDVAFWHCYKLQDININNISNIGKQAFEECNSFSDIELLLLKLLSNKQNLNKRDIEDAKEFLIKFKNEYLVNCNLKEKQKKIEKYDVNPV